MFTSCLHRETANSFFIPKRSVFATPGGKGGGGQPTGPQPGPSKVPEAAPEIAESPVDARRALIQDIEGKAGSFLHVLEAENIRFENWTIADIKNNVIPALRKYFYLVEGVPKSRIAALIEGLEKGEGTEFVDARARLDQIVEILKKRQEALKKTIGGAEEIEKEVVSKSVEGWLGNAWNSFKNARSGTEKLATIGAIGVLAYALFSEKAAGKFETLKKLRTGLFWLACAWGADRLQSKARGKPSLLSQLMNATEKEKLPVQMRALAIRAGLDRPEQFMAVAELGEKSIDQVYNACQKPADSIPMQLGFYHNEVEGKDVKEMMGVLIKEAGGDEKFKEQFYGKKKPWSFAAVTFELFSGKEHMQETVGPEQAKDAQDLVTTNLQNVLPSTLFPVTNMDLNKKILFIKGVPAGIISMPSNKDGIESIIVSFGPNKTVEIPMKPGKKLDDAKKDLERYIKADIERRVASRPEFKGKEPEWTKEGWVYRQVGLIPGKKVDVVVKPQDSNQTKWYVDGVFVGTLTENVLMEQVEKLQYTMEIVNTFPMFSDLNIQIDQIVKAAGKPGVIVIGNIEGSRFTIAADLKTKRFDLKEFDFSSTGFLDKKRDMLAQEIDPKLADLRQMVKNASESVFGYIKRRTPGVSDVGRKGLIYAAIDGKKNEILHNYEELMRAIQAEQSGKPVKEMKQILVWENEFKTHTSRQLDALNQRLAKDVVERDKKGEKFSDAELDELTKTVEGLGHVNQDYTKYLVDFKKSVAPPNFDYEGLDTSEWATTADEILKHIMKVYASLTGKFALKRKALTYDEKTYLDYVRGAMLDKLEKLAATEKGVLAPVLKLQAVRAESPDFGIKHFEEWVKTRILAPKAGPAFYRRSEIQNELFGAVNDAWNTILKVPYDRAKFDKITDRYYDSATKIWKQNFYDEIEIIFKLPSRDAQEEAIRQFKERVMKEFETAKK